MDLCLLMDWVCIQDTQYIKVDGDRHDTLQKALYFKKLFAHKEKLML